MPRRTQEEARQTRQDILMGALSVFSEKGYSRTTLNDIAKRIGMTRGAIYWHFKDKQDLLLALMEIMHQREDQWLEQKVPRVQSLDDLQAQFMARVSLLQEDERFRKFVYFLSGQLEWGTEKRLSERVRDGKKREAPFRDLPIYLLEARERGEIRPDVDLEMVEDIIFGLFIGLTRHFVGGMAKKPLDMCLRTGLQFILDSIRANPAPKDSPREHEDSRPRSV